MHNLIPWLRFAAAEVAHRAFRTADNGPSVGRSSRDGPPQFGILILGRILGAIIKSHRRLRRALVRSGFCALGLAGDGKIADYRFAVDGIAERTFRRERPLHMFNKHPVSLRLLSRYG
jgi:hypothetical protein